MSNRNRFSLSHFGLARVAFSLVCIFMLTGCNSSPFSRATDTPTATVMATHTPQPTPTAIPTATPVPPTRVEFGPEHVERSFSGELLKGAANFVLSGAAGQRLIIELGAADPQLVLTVMGADGALLKPAVAGINQWSGILPASQEYQIQMRSPEDDSGYALKMTLVDALTVDRSAEAVGIALDVANPDTVIEGTVEAGIANRYVLYVDANQTLSVEVASPQNNVLLAIEGAADGQIYKRDLDGAAAWNGVLPLGQEYIISVIPAGESAAYTLAILLDTLRVQPSAPPESVTFEADTNAMRLTGLLDAGGGPRQYVLQAEAGKTLSVIVRSSGAPIQIAATNSDGQRWVSESTDGLASELTFQVPTAGDYELTFWAPLAAGETRYQANLFMR